MGSLAPLGLSRRAERLIRGAWCRCSEAAGDPQSRESGNVTGKTMLPDAALRSLLDARKLRSEMSSRFRRTRSSAVELVKFEGSVVGEKVAETRGRANVPDLEAGNTQE